MSAVSPGDVWAVGYDDPAGPGAAHTLALHWNGGSWSVVRTPSRPEVDRGFFGVSATTASSAWAVGATIDKQTSRLKSLVEHWNGKRWNQAPITSPSGYNILRSVSVVAPGDAWAVGEHATVTGRRNVPLVEHLSGGSWRQVRPPGLGRVGYLTSVSGDGPDDVWAVGYVSGANVLEHWNGQVWSRFRGPASMSGGLMGVTTHGSTATWAVGLHRRGSTYATFKERWNGHVWTR